MDPILRGVYLTLGSAAIGFFGKILWDWLKSGRTEKGEYLTVDAFDKHKEQCCILALKKDFNICQQDSCTVQANHDHRLIIVEEKLKDGQVMFQALNSKMDDKFDSWSVKFDQLIQSVVEIQVTLKYALERERKDNGL